MSMWKKQPNEIQDLGPTSMSDEEFSRPKASSSERAIVGASIIVRGQVEGAQDLTVDGEVEGTIELRDNVVTIGKSGRVRANVYARVIIVEGDVKGDLFGAEKVIVKQSGNVRGNITAPRVSLDDGAKLKGSIDMDPQNAAESDSEEIRHALPNFSTLEQ